jgi:hypothetical protein
VICGSTESTLLDNSAQCEGDLTFVPQQPSSEGSCVRSAHTRRGRNWCAARVDLHLDHRHVISSAGVFFRGEWRVESPRDPLHRELFTNFAPTLSNIIKVHQFNVCPIHNSLIIPIRLPLCAPFRQSFVTIIRCERPRHPGPFSANLKFRRLGRDGSISRTALITR